MRIFISYRREDSARHARRLYETLVERWGEQTVFIDVGTIELGADFVGRIQRGLGASDILLAVIGERWQTARGADGGRRIDAPDDLVRLEIATALAREDMRVIPVLVDGAQVPSAADLPPDLRPLARRNTISLTEADWRSEAAALMGEIEWIMGADIVFTEAPERVRDPKVETPLVRYDGWRAVRWLWMPLVGLAGLMLVGLGQRADKGWWAVAGIVYLIITGSQVPQLMSGHPRTYVITQIVGTAHLVWAQRHYRRMVVGPPS